MSLPRVTTLSGRQAQVKTVMVRHIVTGMETSDNDAVSRQPVIEPFELGPVLDVVPHVQPGGYSIHLTLAASQLEFEGYDDGRRTVTRSDGRRELVKGGEPRPIFRKRQSVSEAVVGDGQTIVLLGGSDQFTTGPKASVPLLGDLPFVGRLFRDSSNGIHKTSLVVFVTATLIDEAGNRIPLPEQLVP